MSLLDKIAKIKEFFLGGRADPQDISTIESWEGEAKRLFLIQSLKGHDGVKYVLEVFKSEVEKINGKLLDSYSKDLSDSERDRMLDRRALAQKLLNLFDVEDEIARLEETVDKDIVAPNRE